MDVLSVRWAVLVQRLAGRRPVPGLEVTGADRFDPIAGIVVVHPGELAPRERWSRRRGTVRTGLAADGVRLGLGTVRHRVLHGGNVDAHHRRAADGVPSGDRRGAIAEFRPVCLGAGVMQALETVAGGMAVRVSVSGADDGDRRLRLGKPRAITAVAAAMMVYFVNVQLPNGGGHAGFDVDVIVRVIAAQVAAGALMVWARVTFGLRSFHATADPTEGGLVTSGPYSTIRHPIYTSVCLFVWAGALAHLSPLSGALAALEFADSLVRMIAEECMLIVRYPEYREYATRPKRMIPFIF